MITFLKSFVAMLAAALFLAACQPTIQTAQQSSPDGTLMAYNVVAEDGQGGVTQALLIKDGSGAWVMQIGVDRVSLGRELITALLSPGVLASVVSGRAAIQIARDGTCDGQCGGTIIYNDGTAVAGSVSNSGAVANSNAEASVDMTGGSGYETHVSSSNFDPTLSLSMEQAVPFLMSMHNLDQDQAEWVYITTVGLRAQLAAM